MEDMRNMAIYILIGALWRLYRMIIATIKAIKLRKLGYFEIKTDETIGLQVGLVFFWPLAIVAYICALLDRKLFEDGGKQ